MAAIENRSHDIFYEVTLPSYGDLNTVHGSERLV